MKNLVTAGHGVCVCVCMHTRVYACTQVGMHVHTCHCVDVCVCVHTCVYVCMHVGMRGHTCHCVLMCHIVWVCVCVCVRAHACVWIDLETISLFMHSHTVWFSQGGTRDKATETNLVYNSPNVSHKIAHTHTHVEGGVEKVERERERARERARESTGVIKQTDLDNPALAACRLTQTDGPSLTGRPISRINPKLLFNLLGNTGRLRGTMHLHVQLANCKTRAAPR